MAQSDFELYSKIADLSTRLEGAKDLARLVGADDLVIFDFDPETGHYTASTGFARENLETKAWRSVISICLEKGFVEASLQSPSHDGESIPFAGKKMSNCLWFFAHGTLSSIERCPRLKLIAKNLSRVFENERNAIRFLDQNAILRQLTIDLKNFAQALSFTNTVKSFLSHASNVLSSSLDYDVTLSAIAKLVTQQMADCCTVKVIGGDGVPRTVTIAHRDEEKIKLLQDLRKESPKNWNQTVGSPNVLRTGRSELYTEVTEDFISRAVHSDIEKEIYRELALCSLMIVPLKIGQRTFGSITFASTSPARRFRQEDLEFAEELARRASIAIENAELYRRAESASRAKTDFLANMSHEIRTPLTAILGFAELMSEPTQSLKDRLDCVSIIRRNGVQLTHLIDEILDLTKIESRQLDLEKAEFSPGELVEDVMGLMSLQAMAKGLQLTVKIDDQMPGRIVSDPTRVRQVLLNLLGNAIKFTSMGEIHLKVASRPVNSGEREVEFRIQDTGIGLTADQAARLFQPFVQADNSMTRKFGGTGLGLALSRKLAKALGGDLILHESAPEKGSTFIFKIKAECRDFDADVSPLLNRNPAPV